MSASPSSSLLARFVPKLGKLIDAFPLGRAPLALLVTMIASGLTLVVSSTSGAPTRRAELTLVTFAKEHRDSYLSLVPEFERRYGVHVNVQLVASDALQSRLQSAMMTGAPVPDMVELTDGSLGYFTNGPLEDVGFVDLTERVRQDGLDRRIIENRFSLWSSRGHVFALPQDVHPVMLGYRRDLVEQLGIDVSKLETWDDFAAVGRSVTRDLNGDGVLDRYMIDLPLEPYGLKILLLQHGGALFDAAGRPTLATSQIAETLAWYVEASYGPKRFAYACGWGPSSEKCLFEGLALFYFMPDWRAAQFPENLPALAGKMALMPLPAWKRGERRVSTWGGTGLAITKACKRKDLAWQLAQFLYYDDTRAGQRFLKTGILPPILSVWSKPQLERPNPYFSGQPLGALMAAQASNVPPYFTTGYSPVAEAKLFAAFQDGIAHFERSGRAGLRETISARLAVYQQELEQLIDRNQFLRKQDR